MDWDQKFLKLAKEISLWSKDPSTKVGCVIVDDMCRIVSCGYNGFARGVNDSNERLNDRDMKLKLTVHAELNALLSSPTSVIGCTLYVYPFQPCCACASAIVQAGIGNVIYQRSRIPDRWKDNFELARQIFQEAGVPTFEMELNEERQD